MSSLPTDHVSAAWPPTPAALIPRLGSVWRLGVRPRRGEVGENADLELGFRFAAVQVGYWLGWASIVIVLAELALDQFSRAAIAGVRSGRAADFALVTKRKESNEMSVVENAKEQLLSCGSRFVCSARSTRVS